jgi:hypothetical protein
VIALPSSICCASFIADDVSSDFRRYSLAHHDEFGFDSKRITNREPMILVFLRSNEQNPETYEVFGTYVSVYRRKNGGVEILTKEIRIFDSARDDHSVESLEMLTHLKHPLIVPLFGIIFQWIRQI